MADHSAEIAVLRNDIQTLRNNKQDRMSASSGVAPQNSEGSDGDTTFRLTSDKGLLMFYKYSGIWYSSPFNIGKWNLEDSINALVQDITVANVTIQESTQASMNISGVFTILNAGTFAVNTSATVTGLSHSDLDDVGSGTGLGGNVHTQYAGAWSISNSQTLEFSTAQIAGDIATGAIETVLKNTSLVADGDGLAVNESGHSFTLDNTLTLQPTSSTSLHIDSAYDDKIKLTDTAVSAYIGSTQHGDLLFKTVDQKKAIFQGNNLADQIDTTSNLVGGSGYVNGSYSAVPLIADIAGVGAKANMVVSGGAVTGFTLITAGVGYAVGEELTADNADLGGTGSGFSIDVATIQESLNTGLSSSQYLSGWAGGGWTLSRPTSGFSAYEWMLEIDNLSVRGTLSVFELLINQIRATNGTLFVSSVAKVFAIVDENTLAFEDPSNNGLTPFSPGDILLCQRVDVGATADAYSDSMTNLVKRVVIEVTAIGSTTIDDTTYGTIDYTTTAGGPTYVGNIAVGDDYVRIGSTSDTARRSSILLTADFANAPFIDFLDGVDSWATWKGTTKNKARLGQLEGIVDDDVGGSLTGYGMYADNVYLKGHMHAQTGYIGTKNAGWTINSDGISTNVAGRKIYMGTGGDADTYGHQDCWFLAESYNPGDGDIEARVSLGDCFKVDSDTHEIKLSESSNNYIHIKNAEPQVAIYSNGARALTFESTGPKFTLGDPDATHPNYLQYSGTDLTLVSHGDQYFKVTSGVTPTVTIGNPTGNSKSWTEITGGTFKLKNRDASGTVTDPIYMDDQGDVVITGSLSIPQDAGSIATAQAAAEAAALAASNAQGDASTAITNASTAQGTADGKVTTFVEDDAPTAEGIGDLWIDTNDGNKLYRWNGANWIDVEDTGIAQAILDASNANSLADSKIVSFYADEPPTATSIGDFWTDTNDSNKLYRASATGSLNWVSVQDSHLDTNVSTMETYFGNMPTPGSPGASTGMFMDNDFIGFATGGAWNSFLWNDNGTGKFYLGGLSGALQWDGSNLSINGGGIFTGALSAATGTFAGNISAATGTFTGSITGATGTFGGTVTGNLNAGSITSTVIDNGSSHLMIKDTHGTSRKLQLAGGTLTSTGSEFDISSVTIIDGIRYPGGKVSVTCQCLFAEANPEIEEITLQYSHDNSNWYNFGVEWAPSGFYEVGSEFMTVTGVQSAVYNMATAGRMYFRMHSDPRGHTGSGNPDGFMATMLNWHVTNMS